MANESSSDPTPEQTKTNPPNLMKFFTIYGYKPDFVVQILKDKENEKEKPKEQAVQNSSQDPPP